VALYEHRNLQEADVAEVGSLTTRKVIQHSAFSGRKPGIAQHRPDPDMRAVEETGADDGRIDLPIGRAPLVAGSG
jgi:hypothetical protein